MLGQSETSLLADPRGASKLMQGVTTELTGEGSSAGPTNDRMIADDATVWERRHINVDWRTLGEYLTRLNDRTKPGVNLGSFVGAGGIRNFIIGRADRPPRRGARRDEDGRAKAMQEGRSACPRRCSMPIDSRRRPNWSSWPASRRSTAASTSRISARERPHLRIARRIFTIAEQAKIPAEIFHLKTAYQPNFGKMPALLDRFEPRGRALDITADQYPYSRAANGLDAACRYGCVRHQGADDRALEGLAARAHQADMADPNATTWENQWVGSAAPTASC